MSFVVSGIALFVNSLVSGHSNHGQFVNLDVCQLRRIHVKRLSSTYPTVSQCEGYESKYGEDVIRKHLVNTYLTRML